MDEEQKPSSTKVEQSEPFYCVLQYLYLFELDMKNIKIKTSLDPISLVWPWFWIYHSSLILSHCFFTDFSK